MHRGTSISVSSRRRLQRCRIRSKWQALPTEAINPASLNIDKLAAGGIVDLMLAEDRKVLAAVQKERDRIALGADMFAKALRKGGRVVFVGAGTSGRLGVLESAEMPPTFGTDPLLVQGIMAGGKNAIFRAKEGAEDNYEEGARAVNRLIPTKKDVVIGVSASGMTPFVRGALTSGAQGRLARRLRDLRSAQRAADLRRSHDRAGGRPRDHRRLDAPQGRHRDQDGAQHADHVAMILIGKTYGNLMVDVQHWARRSCATAPAASCTSSPTSITRKPTSC